MRWVRMVTWFILVGILFGCAFRQDNTSTETSGVSSSFLTASDEAEWKIAANAKAIAEALNEVLDELDYKIGFDRTIFDDQYIYKDLERVSVFWTWKWLGPHINESVVLLYLKDEQRFQPMDLGVYQCLEIRRIDKTQNPDILSITFEDAIFTFGSEYYTRSFLHYLTYSISQDQVVERRYLPLIGEYGMLDTWMSYVHQFRDCEVLDGKRAALRFEVLETDGYPNFPRCTQIVLPQGFEDGLPGEILLPHVKMNLSQELLNEMSTMEGFQSVTAEPMQTGANHGTRLIVTPKPGYTVSCGFEPEDTQDWESTFYLYAIKME